MSELRALEGRPQVVTSALKSLRRDTVAQQLSCVRLPDWWKNNCSVPTDPSETAVYCSVLFLVILFYRTPNNTNTTAVVFPRRLNGKFFTFVFDVPNDYRRSPRIILSIELCFTRPKTAQSLFLSANPPVHDCCAFARRRNDIKLLVGRRALGFQILNFVVYFCFLNRV